MEIKVRKMVLIFLLTFTGNLYASTADQCVELGKGKRYKSDKNNKRYLQNTCGYDIYLFWCHDKNKKGYTSGLCGGKKYYRKFLIFKPGKKTFNQYSIPDNADIKFGACVSSDKHKGRKSVKAFQSNGTYRCAQPSINEDTPIQCADGSKRRLKILQVYGSDNQTIRFEIMGSEERKELLTINIKKSTPEKITGIICNGSGASYSQKMVNKVRQLLIVKTSAWCKKNLGQCTLGKPLLNTGPPAIRQ